MQLTYMGADSVANAAPKRAPAPNPLLVWKRGDKRPLVDILDGLIKNKPKAKRKFKEHTKADHLPSLLARTISFISLLLLFNFFCLYYLPRTKIGISFFCIIVFISSMLTIDFVSKYRKAKIYEREYSQYKSDRKAYERSVNILIATALKDYDPAFLQKVIGCGIQNKPWIVGAIALKEQVCIHLSFLAKEREMMKEKI